MMVQIRTLEYMFGLEANTLYLHTYRNLIRCALFQAFTGPLLTSPVSLESHAHLDHKGLLLLPSRKALEAFEQFLELKRDQRMADNIYKASTLPISKTANLT